MEAKSRGSRLGYDPMAKFRRLNELFKKIKEDSDGTNLAFSCQLCAPAWRRVRTCVSSTGNLKRHIELYHPASLAKFNRLRSSVTPMARDRNTALGYNKPTARNANDRSKRQVQNQLSASSSTHASISQSELDNLVLQYIVGDLLPLRKVKSPAFTNLIAGMIPSRKVPSRKTLQKLLNRKYEENISELRNKLANVRAVCTTADCWSAGTKAVMGITIHWLDKRDVSKRHSALLACRHLVGRQTNDVLVNLLLDIKNEFRIHRKVVSTITDTAANFVQAFNCFGEDITLDTKEPVTPAQFEGSDSEDFSDPEWPFEVSDHVNSGEEDKMVPRPITGLNHTLLPPHTRCLTHTLNLVAKDTEQITDPSYKAMSRAVLAKASALWNQVKGNPQASGSVEEKFRIGFLVPNDTRWNSVFLAMESLSCIATQTIKKQPNTADVTPVNNTDSSQDKLILHSATEELGLSPCSAMETTKEQPNATVVTPARDTDSSQDKLIIHRVTEELGLSPFSAQELDFLHKFVDVLRPLAVTLDILQSEENLFLGYLAPTVVQLQSHMKELLEESQKPTASEGLALCRPLIESVLRSLDVRLAGALEKTEHILSAILMPKFKLDWVADEEKRADYRALLVHEFEGLSCGDEYPFGRSPGLTQSDGEMDIKDVQVSFFRFYRKSDSTTTEVDAYLDAPTTDGFEEYTRLSQLKRLFIKYNTALHSSTSVKRLFGFSGVIFRPWRNCLEDFEKQLILNANKDL